MEPLASGPRLTLRHNSGRKFLAMGAAGWHICFDVLDRFLAGHPIGRIVGGEAMTFGWQRLNAEYARQFGIEVTDPHPKYVSGVRMTMKKSAASEGQPASELISRKIAELGDWRGKTLGRMRKLIKEADPDVVEEWKWMGTPVWSHDGIICTGESYKKVVKLTFAKGAKLKDPARLFNSSLDGNVRRAIDIPEGEEVDASAFKALVRRAVALNIAGKSKSSKKAKS